MIHYSMNQLEKMQEKLENYILNVSIAEKRFDRSQNIIVSEQLKMNKKEDISNPASPHQVDAPSKAEETSDTVYTQQVQLEQY